MYRFILLGMVLCGLLCWVPGCLDGSSSHNVDTGGNGTLDGLYLTPEPQTLDVALDDEFDLNWDYGYLPPDVFTVKLQSVDSDGTKNAIYTKLEKIAIDHYRLVPSWSLPTRTFLLLTISGAGQTVHAIYLTEDNGLFTQQQPAGQPEGEIEHTVRTR